jgi:trimeric autotransporter adhesin
MKRTIFTTLALASATLTTLAVTTSAKAGPSDADLVVNVVSASTTQALADQQIAIDCNILNQGLGAAGSSRLKYYFSVDAYLDGADGYLNYDQVDALAAGGVGSESANVRVPAGTADGSYFVLVVADYDGDVVEADESNNVFALPITVGTPLSGPDVMVDLANLSQSQADPDEQVVASADVVNAGTDTTGAETRLKYYLSSDASYDGSDVYLNWDGVPAIGSQNFSSETANLRVPAATAPGLYYVLFVADQTAVVTETNEDNNVVALELIVGDYTPQPDLVVSGASVSTSLVRAGQAVAVTALVDNVGPIAAPTVKLKYMLSTDTTLSADDKQLSYDQVDSLGAGLVSPEDANLNITSATDAGDYYLLFVADADAQATELDESNNILAVPLSVTKDDPNGILPDLELSSIALGAEVVPAGDTVAVSVSVDNVGVAPAGTSRLKYYFSTDASYDGGDTYLNYDAVGELAVGESSAETANLTIPTEASDGPAFILFVADETDLVAERYESDNVVAHAITVGFVTTTGPGDDPGADLADLVVADAWVDSIQVNAGERPSLGCAVQNQGSQPAGASKVKYYLSRDANFDAGDDYLSYDNVPALGLGDSSEESVLPLIPEDADHGSWHLLMVADANDTVSESYESNNVLALAIEVIVDDPSLDAADLMADSPVLSKAVVGAGYQLEVDTNVVNLGTQPSIESRLKLYLSDDLMHDAEDMFLGHQLLEVVGVGGSVPANARVRIPVEAMDGAQHVLVVVDSYDEVVESFESNNLLAIPMTVGPDAGPNPAYPYVCPSSVFTDAALLPQHTVATFNALHLGWNNGKDMLALACVVSHFDLVGLVEVDAPSGVTALEAELEALTGEGWSSHVSPWAVGNANGSEFYGYLWRDAEVTFTGALGFYDDVNDDLKREPYGANFAMGGFDFSLVVFHLQYGQAISTRRGEAQHLVDVYDYFQNENGAEQDLLIGGDFNLPADDAAFTLIDFRDVGFTTDPEQKTTIGPLGLSNSFDNIFYPRADTVERLASGSHDFTQGNYLTIGDTVSDHLPVWMSFDVTSDDD